MKFEAYQWNQYNQNLTITARCPIMCSEHSDDLLDSQILPTPKNYAYIGMRENNLCFNHTKDNSIIKAPIQYQKGRLYPVYEPQRIASAYISGETEEKDGVIYPDDNDALYVIEYGVLHKYQITRITKDLGIFSGFVSTYARKYIRCIGVTVKPATEMTHEEAAYFRKHCDPYTPQQAYEKEAIDIHGHHHLICDDYCAVYKFSKEESL